MSNVTRDQIKIGVLATLFGPFKTLGDDGLRGVKLAIDEVGGQIAGKKIEMEIGGTDASPDNAYYKAEDMINSSGVDFIVGPLSGNEGLAVRDLAKNHLNKTFINGTAGTQDITLRDQAPNYYNFSLDGAQWMAGLGSYAYRQGYKTMVTLGENYSFPHTQVGGFMVEYYRAGGRVVKKIWTALGQQDYSSAIAEIPDQVDAIFVALGGFDAIQFFQQYERSGKQKPIIGGAIMADQSVLSAQGITSDYLIGVVTAGPTADDNKDPRWDSFVSAYRTCFPDGFNYPSLFALGYYLNTRAAMLALQEVGGDLSGDQSRFKSALNRLRFDGPCGPVHVDHNRQAVSTNYITAAAKDSQGRLYRKLIDTIPNVNQTLGIPEAEYVAMGSFTADNPGL